MYMYMYNSLKSFISMNIDGEVHLRKIGFELHVHVHTKETISQCKVHVTRHL